MTDILTGISTAITLTKRLKEVSEKIKNAEFANLLADLSLQLAETNSNLAQLVNENTELKQRLHVLENAEGDPCPKCHRRGWHVTSSRPHPDLGDLGVSQRAYECSFCGFSENKIVD